MSTFQQLQERLIELENRKVILLHLVSHLDAEFLPAGDRPPKKVLLDPRRVAVPEQAFENVSTELSDELALIDAEISAIKATTIVVPEAPAPAVEAPKKKRNAKSESTTP